MFTSFTVPLFVVVAVLLRVFRETQESSFTRKHKDERGLYTNATNDIAGKLFGDERMQAWKRVSRRPSAEEIAVVFAKSRCVWPFN